MIESGKEYSLVPQVVLYEAGKEYVGSVTKFSGCYNGNMYDQSVKVGACLTGVVNNLTSTSTTDALSAYQGKVLNDKITNIENNYAPLTALNSYVSKGSTLEFYTTDAPSTSSGLYFGGSSDHYNIYMETRSSDDTSLVIEIGDNPNDYVEFRVNPYNDDAATVAKIDGYGNLWLSGHIYINGVLVQ